MSKSLIQFFAFDKNILEINTCKTIEAINKYHPYDECKFSLLLLLSHTL